MDRTWGWMSSHRVSEYGDPAHVLSALCQSPSLPEDPPAPVGTLSSSRKMGTMMKRMMRRVWIMIMPSFSVFRRFICSNVLYPGGVGGQGRA